MLINVLNGSLKKVAILSNELPNAPSYYNDEFHDYLEQGATTFSFTVAKVINNQLQDYTQFLSDQSYFSFRKNGRDYLMTPSSEQSVHETSTEISFFCVSLDRELINEQANSLANTASHNIQWYFDRMGLISRTKITIGINEVSNLTRVINYDAQESKLSRLISVINNFNAEFDFVTTLNNDGSLGTVVLNIYKENDGQNIQGVGTKRDDVRLTFGKNIEDVEVDVSDDGFFNAAYMTGADGFSWKNYAFSYKNSDGVEEFYKRKGSEIAYAPLSAKMFPSQLKTDKGDIWTNSDRTTEYKNANDMWGYIVSQFKQYAYKQITYTVTPSSTLVNQLIGDGRPLQKGDTVIIQDDNYMDIDGNVGLILSARVSEIITSDTNPANNKIVFSNYKKLKSEVKYLGMSDLTASDGTVILSGTEYYWSGTNWILNEINAHNINGDNLSVTNGTFTDGKIKSTWNSGTASGSTEIENSHINMSATNSSSKVTNSLGLDIQQGFGMRWTDPASNQSRSVSLDYGNLAFDRNGVAAGLNFDGTNLSSSMPIQAPNTIVKSTQFSVSGIGIRLDRMMSFVAVTFSGQASSTINNSPTIINVLPDGFRPISPYSIDYMVPGNTANNGYIYFNPDGSIRIMATINSGYYIRGTRFYITNDVYPS
ncbi:capsid and scaffold protein [Lactococcus phage CHPC836]|nr:capsid and scaffold protein [Lactococcus phage CHPC836]